MNWIGAVISRCVLETMTKLEEPCVILGRRTTSGWRCKCYVTQGCATTRFASACSNVNAVSTAPCLNYDWLTASLQLPIGECDKCQANSNEADMKIALSDCVEKGLCALSENPFIVCKHTDNSDHDARVLEHEMVEGGPKIHYR